MKNSLTALQMKFEISLSVHTRMNNSFDPYTDCRHQIAALMLGTSETCQKSTSNTGGAYCCGRVMSLGNAASLLSVLSRRNVVRAYLFDYSFLLRNSHDGSSFDLKTRQFADDAVNLIKFEHFHTRNAVPPDCHGEKLLHLSRIANGRSPHRQACFAFSKLEYLREASSRAYLAQSSEKARGAD